MAMGLDRLVVVDRFAKPIRVPRAVGEEEKKNGGEQTGERVSASLPFRPVTLVKQALIVDGRRVQCPFSRSPQPSREQSLRLPPIIPTIPHVGFVELTCR